MQHYGQAAVGAQLSRDSGRLGSVCNFLGVISLKCTLCRVHYGTESLDITIPTQVCKENKIREGDIFSVDVFEERNQLILKYTRVFENK